MSQPPDDRSDRGLQPRRRAGRSIGLLGGSFNPAHSGHLHISRLALRSLGLDEVWWLVSPQNPLKANTEMAPFAERFAGARACARESRIRVSDIEARLGSKRSYDTVRRLHRLYPYIRFVWIIGADNLVQLPRWHRWRDLIETVPIVVFDRPPYSYPALAGQAASLFRRHRLPMRLAHRLAEHSPPVWTFLWLASDPTSATAIRRQDKHARAKA